MYEWNDKIICPWDPTADSNRIAQYKDYYKVKYDICAELKSDIIIEIGVRAGYSAYYFLKARPNAIYYGFDADKEEYTNLLERGIIDPAKVTRAAVENGASVATMLLTTESMVTDIPDKTPATPPMPPMDY